MLAFTGSHRYVADYLVDEVLNRLFRVSRRRPLLQRLIVYWAVLGMFEPLGNNAVLHPALAAWAPNFLYGFAGAYLMLFVRS